MVEQALDNEQLLSYMEALRAEDPEHCLKPKDVVEAARPEESPIHSHFEWDDTRAAEAHRLNQAGKLIARVEMEITLRGAPVQNVKVKTYHYLPADRKVGRGYRHRDDIKRSRNHLADLRAELVSDLNRLMTRFRPFFPTEAGRIEALLAEL